MSTYTGEKYRSIMKALGMHSGEGLRVSENELADLVMQSLGALANSVRGIIAEHTRQGKDFILQPNQLAAMEYAVEEMQKAIKTAQKVAVKDEKQKQGRFF